MSREVEIIAAPKGSVATMASPFLYANAVISRTHFNVDQCLKLILCYFFFLLLAVCTPHAEYYALCLFGGVCAATLTF